MSYTPGPWRWWVTVCGARVAGRPEDGSQNFVCDVLIPERAVRYEDNARLIAAAPELLASLRFMVSNIGEPVGIETRDGFNEAKALLRRLDKKAGIE